jgi:UDP-glucose:(heptosyl)LPS alpha-1,3-glucosyltransferase
MDPTQQRLKIAVLHRTFLANAGGAEAYAVAVALELSQRHEVHVFAQEMDTSLQSVTYHPIALFFKRPRWLNQLWFALATWWKTRAGFDIVHSHENTWHGNVQTVHVIPMRCKPKHGWIHALQWATSPRLWTYAALEFFRFRWHAKRCWVAVSQPLLEQLSRMRPVLPLHQLFAIAPGIYPMTDEIGHLPSSVFFKSQDASSKVLLWVGNDAVKKNLQTVITALASLDATFHLLVAGKALPDKAWQDQLRTLGLTDRVRWLGVVSDMSAVYACADLLLHPTLEDTFGMVVLEAMSHGLPVIVSSSDHCGISADLTHGLNAYVLKNPCDAPALADAVIEVMATQGDVKYSDNARAYALQHRWSDVAQHYEVLFQHIVSV